MPLDIESLHRGEWNVVTRPGGVRVTPYTLPNQKAAKAACKAIDEAVPDFPWDVVGRDQLKAALQVYGDTHGRSLTDTVLHALAAVPAADPHGYCARHVRDREAARAEAAAFVASEEADGYTEVVDHDDVSPGDEISFRYVLTKTRPGFTGLRPIEQGTARTVVVRGTVAGPYRWMNRHSNNYDEFMTGPRFPLAEATWHEDGASGPLEADVTYDCLRPLRRRPRPRTS